MKNNLKQILFLIFLCTISLHAQPEKDTSFTIYSTFQKTVKDFPFIEIASPEIPSGVKIIPDIVYNSPGKRDLKLDIFLSGLDGKEKHPAIILVYGGGWRSGDKSQNHSLAIEFASRGFISASVEYRLSGEAKYPAAVLDLKSAIRWIKKNSAAYSIDTGKIAIMGFSAGGHLAALVGTTNYNSNFDSDTLENISSAVHAIIDVDGVLDFTDPAESGKDTDPDKPSVGKLWLGYSYKDNPGKWVEASPLTHVNNNCPPVLFINSSIPRFHAGRDEMIEILDKNNIYSEVHTIENTPHPFWFFHPWFNQVVDISTKFLSKVFNN